MELSQGRGPEKSGAVARQVGSRSHENRDDMTLRAVSADELSLFTEPNLTSQAAASNRFDELCDASYVEPQAQADVAHGVQTENGFLWCLLDWQPVSSCAAT